MSREKVRPAGLKPAALWLRSSVISRSFIQLSYGRTFHTQSKHLIGKHSGRLVAYSVPQAHAKAD